MIVVAIIGILAAVALPQYQTYVSKSKYAEVVSAANAVKGAIEICAQVEQDLADSDTYGELDYTQVAAEAGDYTASVAITATTAVITATSTADAGGYTYILTPTLGATEITWATSGTCVAANYC